MTIKLPSRGAALLTLSLFAALPFSAQAHRAWMLPSSTVVSSNNAWVTIDAASSNDLFYFDHRPLRLEQLQITAPDGSKATAENQSTGAYRSTFDLKLAQQGTYRIALANNPQRRVEVFVTAGKPTDKVLQPTGSGFEFAPITHPNDLYAGETAEFRFLMDGKPVEGAQVSVIPGGIRYRDQLGEMKFTTDKDGKIAVKWPEPGMYWLNARVGGARSEGGPASTPAAGAAPPPPAAPVAGGPPQGQNGPRGSSYTATLEVLAL